MRRTICSFLAFVFAYLPIFVQAKEHDSRQRLIVTTDLGGTDPDDTESMIHLLVCSNMVDIEGIISSQVWSDYPDRVGKIKTLHLILEVTDSGTPALTSYRRVVIQVK